MTMCDQIVHTYILTLSRKCYNNMQNGDEEYDLEMFSLTNFYCRGKNIKNKGIRISKHFGNFINFSMKKMMFFPEGYQLMWSIFCRDSVFICLL